MGTRRRLAMGPPVNHRPQSRIGESFGPASEQGKPVRPGPGRCEDRSAVGPCESKCRAKQTFDPGLDRLGPFLSSSLAGLIQRPQKPAPFANRQLPRDPFRVKGSVEPAFHRRGKPALDPCPERSLARRLIKGILVFNLLALQTRLQCSGRPRITRPGFQGILIARHLIGLPHEC
jgi:hypothetical protein